MVKDANAALKALARDVCGVAGYNEWRVRNSSTLDFARLDLRGCDLRGADLTKVRNLTLGQVAGADLAGALVDGNLLLKPVLDGLGSACANARKPTKSVASSQKPWGNIITR